MLLLVTNIQHFSTHDGPGIRTCVFLKGCPLRCRWCHNPETQSERQQILYNQSLCIGCRSCQTVCVLEAHTFSETGGHVFDPARCNGCSECAGVCPSTAIENAAAYDTVDQIMAQVRCDDVFYGEEGGITVSGGEPMLHPEKCIALLKAAKHDRIHTALETCGYFDKKHIPELSELVDLFLWDFKDSDPLRHQKNTGVSNDKIVENLYALDAFDVKIVLRCILVNGINCESSHYQAIAQLYGELEHCNEVNLIPYHAFGGSKCILLGEADNGRADWIPTEKQVEEARESLMQSNVNVK